MRISSANSQQYVHRTHTSTHPLTLACSPPIIPKCFDTDFTQIFISIFPPVFEPIVVCSCLVWWQMVFLVAISLPNISKVYLQISCDTIHTHHAHCMFNRIAFHIHILAHPILHLIHHPALKGNVQHLILFAYGFHIIFSFDPSSSLPRSFSHSSYAVWFRESESRQQGPLIECCKNGETWYE